MYSLLSQIRRLIPSFNSASNVTPLDGVAQSLLERAEADAGRNPHQAQELRDAASAYLSVIR